MASGWKVVRLIAQDASGYIKPNDAENSRNKMHTPVIQYFMISAWRISISPDR